MFCGRRIPYIRGLPTVRVSARRHRPDPMTDTHMRTAERMKRDVSADGGALFRTIARLWPYIWPSDRRDLQWRVVLATLLLFGAKLATVAVPFTFKWAVDALTGQGSAPVAADSWLAWAIAAPIAMTLAYGVHAHPDGGADAAARRRVRQGGDACGAAARDPHLRAHARAVAALPSGAQDRRADARAGARPQRASRPSCAW